MKVRLHFKLSPLGRDQTNSILFFALVQKYNSKKEDHFHLPNMHWSGKEHIPIEDFHFGIAYDLPPTHSYYVQY